MLFITLCCHLCSKSHELRTPATLNEEYREWVEKYTALPTDVLICKACIIYIKRHAVSDTQPRWLPKQSKTQPSCMVNDCNRPFRGSTGIASCEPTCNKEKLTITAVSFYATSTTNTCIGCWTIQHLAQHVPHYSKKVRDESVLTPLLSASIWGTPQMAAWHVIIYSELCNTCYKLHLHILKQQEECPTLEHLLLQPFNTS